MQQLFYKTEKKMDKRIKDLPVFERVVACFPNLSRAAHLIGMPRSYITKLRKKGYFPPCYHYNILKYCGDNVTHEELYNTWKAATDEYFDKAN